MEPKRKAGTPDWLDGSVTRIKVCNASCMCISVEVCINSHTVEFEPVIERESCTAHGH